MKQKQNIQLNYIFGDSKVICKHCKLNRRCPLPQSHVPIVDIVRLCGGVFLLEVTCLVCETSGYGDAMVMGWVKDAVLRGRGRLDE